MTHGFMESEQKQIAKDTWGFSAVPFLVVCVKGVVVMHGPPTVVTSEVILDVLSRSTVASTDAAAGALAEVATPAGQTEPLESFTTDEDF
jgi:hypothetical protein